MKKLLAYIFAISLVSYSFAQVSSANSGHNKHFIVTGVLYFAPQSPIPSKNLPKNHLHQTIKNYSTSISIYPNPTRNLLIINIPKFPNTSFLQISILNQNGKTLFFKTFQSPLLPTNKKLNLNNLPPGEYILIIRTNSLKISKQIIKI